MRLLLIVPLLILGCSIVGVKGPVSPDKTVLIIPFNSQLKLKKEIRTEAEEKFGGVLDKLGYRVIERNKLEMLLAEKEFANAGLTRENIKVMAKRLNAGLVHSGEILEHSEFDRNDHLYDTFIFGSQLFDSQNSGSGDGKIKTYFKFKIVVKLINVVDGSEIISVENHSPEAEKDDNLPGYISLDAYRALVLEKMAGEFKDGLSRKTK